MIVYISTARLFFTNAYCNHQKPLHLFYKLHYVRIKEYILFEKWIKEDLEGIRED